MKNTLSKLKIVVLGLLVLPVEIFGQNDSVTTASGATLYLVGNAHLDSQWKWTAKQSVSEYLPHTLNQNFFLFENFPDYVFNFEGAVKYSWIKEYYPEKYEILKQYVSSGQWRVAGSLWEASDMIVPSTESLMKNILLGQEFFKREFGRKCYDIMLPDCFGFPYTLPTIARHCGLIGFSTQKLRWRYGDFYGDGKKWPFEFGIWKGIDGSKIFAVANGGDYTWNPVDDIRSDRTLDSLIDASPVRSLYRYFGTVSSRGQADRGGSPLPEAVENISRCMASPEGFRIIMAGSDSIYKANIGMLDKDVLPVFDGELLMDTHGAGCYTAIASMKHLNRENEKLGFSAEGISSIADWTGGVEYPKDQLNGAYKRFLWHQFHDDLTGTSIPEVYQISWNDEYISMNQFRTAIDAGLGAIVKNMKMKGDGKVAVVYNPLGVVNNGLVTLRIPNSLAGGNPAIYDSDGRIVRSQISHKDSLHTYVLVACSVPPFGTKVLRIGNGKKPVRYNTGLKVSGNSIENRFYRIELDSEGNIASVFDKRYHKELVERGNPFSLVVLEDNRSDEWPAWEIYKSTLDQKPVRAATGQATISVEENGPLRAALKIEKQYCETRIVQRIILTDGAADDRIDIENVIDWREEGKLMKAAFPFSFGASFANYDLGLGHIKRGNNSDTAYEVYAHRWADLTSDDGSYGVTLITDGKYGWDKPDDNTLRLSLFHSPTADKNRYVSHRYQDRGTHRFTYSIIGHRGGLDGAYASSAADIMSHDKYAVIADSNNEGVLPEDFSFIKSSSDRVQVRCLKKAEDGDGYIVRVYNPTDNDVRNAYLAFFAGIDSAEEVNGIEEYYGTAVYHGHKLTVSLPAFSMKTFRVRMQAPVAPAVRTIDRFIDLPFDKVAITSNAFMSIGHMDRAWQSYAAEQLPDTLYHNGVKFVFGEPNVRNAVSCRKQEIVIPEGSGAVYLLVASSEGDRTGTFVTEDGTFSAVIPEWTGYYGQFTMKGMPEPFVKDGDIAYAGDHRHDSAGKDEPFENTYMYMIRIPVVKAKSIVLPDDEKITVFAATAQCQDNL